MTGPASTPATVMDPEAEWEQGLTSGEVEERRLQGQLNVAPTGTSRSVASILVSNVCTRFNVLLGVLLVAILVIGPLQDALFGLVLLVNTPVGIVQELRAKRTLDRLAVMTAPTARVIRDGLNQEIPAVSLVVGDVIELHGGDQVPVDGLVVRAIGLEIDESLVTGESAPAEKRQGHEVLSGSFVVGGSGLIRSTKVGLAAYGNVLAAEARRFAPVRSELRRGIDRLLLIIGILIVPFGAALVISQVHANDTPAEAVRASVAGLVTMIPEGLVLLTSVVFAIAAVRFAERGLIAQELASVECSLALTWCVSTRPGRSPTAGSPSKAWCIWEPISAPWSPHSAPWPPLILTRIRRLLRLRSRCRPRWIGDRRISCLSRRSESGVVQRSTVTARGSWERPRSSDYRPAQRLRVNVRVTWLRQETASWWSGESDRSRRSMKLCLRWRRPP